MANSAKKFCAVIEQEMDDLLGAPIISMTLLSEMGLSPTQNSKTGKIMTLLKKSLMKKAANEVSEKEDG